MQSETGNDVLFRPTTIYQVIIKQNTIKFEQKKVHLFNLCRCAKQCFCCLRLSCTDMKLIANKLFTLENFIDYKPIHKLAIYSLIQNEANPSAADRHQSIYS